MSSDSPSSVSPNSQRIISLQPFYGGSHRAFIDGWVKYSRHSWQQLTLPDRFWKWRMHHAAVDFSSRLNSGFDRPFDAIVTTDMLNVAEFRGLLNSTHRDTPVIVYFHENQAAYPVQNPSERDLHYAYINFSSTLAATEVWFNSNFNLDSFLGSVQDCFGVWPDRQPKAELASLPFKFKIEYPGIEIEGFDLTATGLGGPRHDSSTGPAIPLHLVWAARWEHDKNPGQLLRILSRLAELNVDFAVSVLGQNYRTVPPEFEKIKQSFADRILNWGYMPTRSEYWQALAAGDVVLSTANHEFFGLSVVEGMSVGLRALVPNRLAYPEVLGCCGADGQLFDNEEQAALILTAWSTELTELRKPGKRQQQAEQVLGKFGWPTRALELDSALESAINR